MALKIELKALQKVYVSEVTDSGKFFVQLDTPEAYRLPDLSVEIQTSVESNPVRVIPEQGLQCYACSSADHAWYRAVVTTAKGSTATVYFVDYGNTETVPAASLRGASGHHFDTPYQAVCCTLSDFIPLRGKYSSQTVAVLQERLLNHEFTAVFRSSNSSRRHPFLPSLPCYNLTLLVGDPSLETSLSQQLVASGLGHLSICAEDIHTGSKETVFACYVDSPGKLWVQLSESLTSLQDIMDKLNSQQGHEGMAPLHASAFYPGVACCALFSEDGMFYRSEIVQATQKAVEVRYIDYGNCETIDPSEVFSIPPQLVLSPAHAIQCCLDGIKPVSSGMFSTFAAVSHWGGGGGRGWNFPPSPPQNFNFFFDTQCFISNSFLGAPEATSEHLNFKKLLGGEHAPRHPRGGSLHALRRPGGGTLHALSRPGGGSLHALSRPGGGSLHALRRPGGGTLHAPRRPGGGSLHARSFSKSPV